VRAVTEDEVDFLVIGSGAGGAPLTSTLYIGLPTAG